MALNGTGIEFGKSEHDSRWRISRATTESADFIVLGQRCGQQVSGRKVGHMPRPPPLACSDRGPSSDRRRDPGVPVPAGGCRCAPA